jgi:hypothetical protein
MALTVRAIEWRRGISREVTSDTKPAIDLEIQNYCYPHLFQLISEHLRTLMNSLNPRNH